MTDHFFSSTALHDGAVRGHYPTLIFLRACAVLLVMSFHLLPHEAVTGIPVVEYIVHRGDIGVYLFFMISGFIVPYAMWKNGYTLKSLHIFLAKRLVRLEPPYLLSMLFVVFMQWLLCQVYGWEFTWEWKRMFLHVGYLNEYFGYPSYIVVYWSLMLELQFYVMIGLIYSALVTRFQWPAILTLIAFCAVARFVVIPYNMAIFQYAGMFSVGIVLFLYAVKKINVYVFILATVAACINVYMMNAPDVAVLAVCTVLIMLFLNVKWKFFAFIGGISYSLYLLHIEVSNWFKIYVQEHITNQWLLTVLAITVVFLFCWGFYHLVEAPAQRWSKRIKYLK